MKPYFSIIVPVFDRPAEIDELLQSLARQSDRDFEVIVVDDGSQATCKDIVEKYSNEISVNYHYKENSGPGQTRNFAARFSCGEYLIILDSDCILPPSYISVVKKTLKKSSYDAFGGPDKAHDSFSDIQKAINYAMTSFFTTGGIRGGDKKLDKFYPRSFNMGIRRSVFDDLGGFSTMRFGEDIDLSIRIYEKGYSCILLPQAWVYHKRRTNLKKFFKQVHNSGIARINLYKRHPQSLKAVHMLPACFTIGTTALVLCSPVYPYALLPIVVYAGILCTDASIREKSLKIGLLSIVSSFVQLIGYGSGFIRAVWRRIIMHKGEFGAFEQNFYK